jgi:hypothetical protein
MNIIIIVATHKKYQMPLDPMYLPVQSGSSLYPDLGYQKDNEGDNISHKNTAYNIMCPKYWAWKNVNANYIGIAHYRRHFSLNKGEKKSFDKILSEQEALGLFEETDILLSPKRYYPFFTIESHYTHTKGGYKAIHKRDLEVLRDVIKEFHNEYTSSFETVMKRNFYHSGSLFIMKQSLYSDYCVFIFSIGDEVEKRLKNERPDLTRYIASLTELLIDVWILKHNYSFKEIGLIDFEKPSFLKKVFLLLRRSITGYYKGTINYNSK